MAVTTKLYGYSVALLAVLVIASLVFAFANPFQLTLPYFLLANISGWLALVFIVAAGAMMMFKKQLLRVTRNPDGIRWVHVIISALAGVFLVVHIAFLFDYPLTLPVLFGYVGSGVALAVWVTGLTFFKGLRSSLFYHSLLSLVGISLIAAHAFSAGIRIPDAITGLTFTLIACVVLLVGIRPLIGIWRSEKSDSSLKT